MQHQGTIKCASLMTQHCQLGSTSFLKVLSPTKGTKLLKLTLQYVIFQETLKTESTITSESHTSIGLLF